MEEQFVTKRNSMHKKGLIEMGAIMLVIITTIGAIVVLSESRNIYVGDSRTNEVYNYDKCSEKIDAIPKENQIIFKDLKDAEEKEYRKVKECI